MFWPGALPAPQLSGDTAVYPEVAAGIDLVVRTSPIDGMAQYLVVKDRAAASSPLLSNLVLTWTATGVSLRKSPAGGLDAVAADGSVAFTVPVPQMWGSALGVTAGTGVTAAEKARDVVARPIEAKTAVVGVELAGNRLQLTPSRAMLDDPATVYPVVIDPIIYERKMRWAMVWSDGQSFDNAPDSTNARVGYDGWSGMKKSRVYYQMSTTGPWNGKDIIKADFRHRQIHSPNGGANRVDCNLGSYGPPVELGFTGVIPGGVSWSNQPAWLQTIASNGFAVGSSAFCNDQREQSWEITDWVRGHQGYNNITFGLRSANESDRDGWRQYTHVSKEGWPYPVLVVEYNTRPDVPGAPWVSNRLWDNQPIANIPQPEFRSTVRDGDGGQVRAVHLIQQVPDPDGRTYPVVELPGTMVNSGDTSVSKPFWNLCNCTFEVWARAEDGTGRSADGPRTTFAVDTINPDAPSVTGQSTRAYVGQRIEVTLSSTSSDVIGYKWSAGSNSLAQYVAANGTAPVTVLVPTSAPGPLDMYAVAVDRAGLESATTHRGPIVTVMAPPVGHRYTLDGSMADQPGPNTTGVPLFSPLDWMADLTANGAWYHNDPNDLGSGVNVCTDKAYRLSTQFVRSATPIVDTTGSFSVMAWAQVDPAGLITTGDRRGVLSLPLPNAWPKNAMTLGLHKKQSGAMVWAFGVANGQGSANEMVWADSTVVAQAGQWVHLMGVYNKGQNKLEFFVNGQTVTEVPFTGTVPMSDYLGVGMAPPTDPATADAQWIGRIDDVRTFPGVESIDIARNIVQGAPDMVACPGAN
ncbi:hypothetical protein GCM10028815_06570 [Mariniluteicoccus flavus]